MAEAANVREWTDTIRRSRLDRTTKGVAFLLATFADSDGSRIFPGVARVAVTAGVDYKTAKRVLATLMNCGLLEKVRGKSGRRGRSDEYRLCFDESLMWSADIRPPNVLDAEIEQMRAKNRRSGRAPRTGNETARPQGEDIDDDAPPEEVGTGNGVPANHEGRGTAFRQDGERLSAVPNHRDLVTTTTLHNPSGAFRTDEDVGGESTTATKIQSGNGFCLDCYRSGAYTLAAEPDGSACGFHLAKGVAA